MKKDTSHYDILVVEDNTGDFILLSEFLNDVIEKPVVHHALDFKRAITFLTNRQFDIIFLDLSLPDKSGEELIGEIIPFALTCPVIILTGRADIDFGIRSISLGVSDYLVKDELTPLALYKSLTYSIERKKMLFKHIESEQRYSDLFYLSPHPMWVLDPRTLRFLEVNDAALELYGYSDEEFLQMSILELSFQENDSESQNSIRHQKAASNKTFEGAFRHRKKDGTIVEVEMYSSHISANQDVYQLVTAIDVTERNRHEESIIKAIIKTQEDERYELGIELHDNICQLLALSQMKLKLMKSSLDDSGISLYQQCQESLNLALKEVRKLSHGLAPAFNETMTLEDEFNHLLSAFNAENRYQIVCQFDNRIAAAEIDLELKRCLYRILQEQLANISKHAQATAIQVFVCLGEGKIQLDIFDNGLGFDENTVRFGIGLSNIRRRVASFSGQCTIESAPGCGCKILIAIPFVSDCIGTSLRYSKIGISAG
jgi:PAS domain S-box-containing protein